MFKAAKSKSVYNLARNVPGFGVGVTTVIAEASATTAVKMVNHGLPCNNDNNCSITNIFMLNTINILVICNF